MSPEDPFHEDARVRLCSWRNVGIATWFNAPEMPQLARLRGFSEDMHRRYPEGYGFMSVVRSGVPNFSAEVRAESSAIVRDTAAWGYGTAHVVLVDGFVGVAVRSFLSTMLLMSRSKERAKVFGDLPAGAAFLVECMGAAAPEVDGLAEIAEQLSTPPRD